MYKQTSIRHNSDTHYFSVFLKLAFFTSTSKNYVLEIENKTLKSTFTFRRGISAAFLVSFTCLIQFLQQWRLFIKTRAGYHTLLPAYT